MERNLGAVDRLVRGSVGALLIAIGGLLFGGIIRVMLCLLGALLAFSAATGFCHVYKVLHLNTIKEARDHSE